MKKEMQQNGSRKQENTYSTEKENQNHRDYNQQIHEEYQIEVPARYLKFSVLRKLVQIDPESHESCGQH